MDNLSETLEFVKQGVDPGNEGATAVGYWLLVCSLPGRDEQRSDYSTRSRHWRIDDNRRDTKADLVKNLFKVMTTKNDLAVASDEALPTEKKSGAGSSSPGEIVKGDF